MSTKTALLKAFDDVSAKADETVRLFVRTIGDRPTNVRHAAALAVAIPFTLVAGTLADAGYVLVSRSEDFGTAEHAMSRPRTRTDLDRTT